MRKVLIAGLVLAVIGLIAYSVGGSKTTLALDDAYVAKLREARRQKDQSFHSGPSSPLPTVQQATFAGLRYFPPATEFRVLARITRLPVLLPQSITMSTGSQENYQRWGTAEFELAGQPQKLILLQKAGVVNKELSVLFTDPTNGPQTYAGGRYLDLPIPTAESNEIELDFNQAYSPFCAYNHDYSCPKPPAENRLTVAVTAGEQLYQLQ
jgi:uncharacterized protein (DUF1684 family)